jgi:CheY-like chemotaxis protein
MKNAMKCFLIEDDEDDQELFQTALGEVASTTECVVSMSADKALVTLRKMDVLPDFIFLDLNLPGMNGFQFLQEIKQDTHLKSVPVIIHSTTTEKSEILKCKALGADGFFTKSSRYEEMCKMLRRFFVNGNGYD